MSAQRKKMMSMNAAVIRYGTSRSALYRLANEGELTLYKVGRWNRFDVAELDRVFHGEMVSDELIG